MESAPKRWHTREESGIRLDRSLRWWHDDAPVEHPKIIEAFNRGIHAREDGRYELRIGNDWCLIQVEDAAFAVVCIDVGAGGAVSLRLSDRTAEALDPSSLTLGDDGVFFARVKSGRAKARFSREAQFQLGALLESHQGQYVLRLGDAHVSLPQLAHND